MTDLVEWLRGIHKSRQRLLETEDFECSFEQAADEIERLQAQIKEWEEWAKQFKGRALEPKP